MSFKETELGRFPDDWEIDTMENALESIIDYRGKTPQKSEKGIPTLSAKSVKTGFIDYSNAYFISAETYKKFMVRGMPKLGDILMTTEAPLGCIAKLDRDDVGIAQRLLTLRGKKEYLFNDYLMYYLISDIGQHQLKSRSSGTTVTGIKQSEFRKVLIAVPPIIEQKAIANTLSCLDDKIELNNRINKNLEEMAQAIFKSWFVDFEPFQDGEFEDSELGSIPKGWRVRKLDDFIDFYNGYAFKSKDLLNAKVQRSYNVFKMGHIKKGGGLNIYGTKSWIERKHCKNLKKYVLKIGDLLMCMTDMKGNVVLLGHTALMNTDDKYIVNQRVGLLRTNNNMGINFPYLYILTNNYKFIENLRGRANSGVQVNLSTNEIKASKMIVAPKEVNLRYNEIVMPMFEQMFKLLDENQTILNIRDALLPKLMSGEIRIPLEEVQ